MMKRSLNSLFRAGLVASALFAIVTVSPSGTLSQTTLTSDIPPGYSLIDGDLLMPTNYVNAVLDRKPGEPMPTNAAVLNQLWTNGIVNFRFSANVTPANQALMISAMAVLESVANVHFQQCPDNSCLPFSNFVSVRSSTANNSMVGMVGLEQVINIVSWNSQYTIVHELLHCLGVYHEHQRADRGTFIQINCGLVQGGCGGTIFNSNFLVENKAIVYGGYDFDSVMHYSQCAFTTGLNCPTDATQTISVLPPNQNQQGLIGQGGNLNHLSLLDRATISFLYPNSDWRFFDCTNGGSQTGTFWSPYSSFAAALANTPAGGTIWVLNNCSIPAGTYSNSVTIRTAPGVTATFGG